MGQSMPTTAVETNHKESLNKDNNINEGVESAEKVSELNSQIRLMSSGSNVLREKASSRNIIRSFKSVNSSVKRRRDLLVFMGDM